MLIHISQIHRQTILEQSPVKALNLVLQALLDLTGSEYGFVGEVLRDEQGAPFLRSYAVTNIGWNEEIRALYEQYITTGMDFRNLNTLFGHVLKTRETLIANDAQAHPSAGGLPPGHPPLKHFAGIVVTQGEEMIGMCGLANRPGGYSPELVQMLRPLVGAAGMMISGLRVMRDLDAVRTEANRQGELRKAVVSASGECVLIVDGKGRIREFNPAATALFGWAEQEVLGMSASALLAPSEKRGLYDKALRDGPTAGSLLELPAVRRDGQPLVIEITVSRIAAGDEASVAVFIKDVSEERHAALELQRARELNEETTRGKLSFIAVVSHEIRTPLATIASALDLLADGALDEQSRAYLQAAQSASNALLDLVGNVLDFSRIEAGEARTAEGHFSPAGLLREVCEQFTPAAMSKGLSLVVEGALSLDCELSGDEIRMRQIISNLVSNAIKFTDRGRVVLAGTMRAVGHDTVQLTIDIRDSGVGMPEAFRERIFGQFAQADSSLSRGRSGTGLGLAISRRLATLMGGTLELVDTSAAGSHFQLRLNLPVQSPSPSKVIAAGSVAPPVASEGLTRPLTATSILAVDDNALNQTLLRKQLERGGYTVTVASSGAEALALMLHRHFDLVLMDLEMPGMDGIEVVKRFRLDEAGRNPGTSIPIMALTGHAPVEYRLRALEAGMDAFLTKPYRIRELLAAIERALPVRTGH